MLLLALALPASFFPALGAVVAVDTVPKQYDISPNCPLDVADADTGGGKPRPYGNIVGICKRAPARGAHTVVWAGLAPARYDDSVSSVGAGLAPARYDDSVSSVGAGLAPARYDDSPEPPDTSFRRPRSPPVEERGKLSREEFFQLAFGKRGPSRERNFAVRLFSEGRGFGEAEVEWGRGFREFDFFSRSFARFLDTLLLPEDREALGGDVFVSGRFNSGLLSALGYGVEIAELDFILRVVVPPEAKRLQRTNLDYVKREPRGEEIAPARLSFYMNLRADGGYSYTEYDYSGYYSNSYGLNRSVREYRELMTYGFDGALSLYGWVLEGGGTVREPVDGVPLGWEHVSRGNAWVTRDFARRHSRLTFGDVFSGGSFAGGETVGGARFEYNRSFFGNDPRHGSDTVTFFMPRPGYVEIHTDGRFERIVNLPAGHHELSGFRGRVGRNDVRLLLRMDDGSIEEIPFEYVLGDSRNLLKGESRYSAAAGMRRYYAPAPEFYRYSFREPAFSADYSYGLHPMVTAGAAGRVSEYNRVLGARVIWSLDSAGIADWRGYLNAADSSSLGYRTDVSYSVDPYKALLKLFGGRVYINRRIKHLRVTLGGFLQGASYTPGLFRDYAGDPDYGAFAGVSGTFGFNLPEWNISATGNVNFNRDVEDIFAYSKESYRAGLRASHSRDGFSATAGAGLNFSDGKHSPYLSLNGGYTLRAGRRHRVSLNAGAETRKVYPAPYRRRIEYPDSVLRSPGFDGPLYETVGGGGKFDAGANANARWNWSNGVIGSGAQSYSASAGIRDFLPSGQVNASHAYNRFDLRAGYNYAGREYSYFNTQSHTARASLGASFMFADGLWAIGRPTYGNFVLVDTRQNLRGAAVHVGKSSRGEFSRSGWLGAAYQNVIWEYTPAEIALSLSNIPPGVWFDRHQYHIGGAYRQGYALRVGEEALALAVMRVMRNGEPVVHAHVTVEARDKSGKPFKKETFTNSRGILQIGGMAPGRSYRVRFSPETYIKDYILEVPAGADAILDMGDIEVEVEGVDLEVDLDVDLD